MSVRMPNFLKKENLIYIIKNQTPDGETFYIAKDDAPEEIKQEVEEWNDMVNWSKENYIEL